MNKTDYARLRHLLYHACEGGLQNRDEYAELVGLVTDLRLDELADRKALREAKATRNRLAQCMASHASCDVHSASEADEACPFCEDRAAYAAYLKAGGRDYRNLAVLAAHDRIGAKR